MAKDLRFGTGDLQYHLFWLEKHGFVKTKKSGFYRHVYPTMVFQDDQEVLLSVLAQETPREIILSLLYEPTITQGNIARRLGHSQPSISWRMDRLLKLGMISKRRTSPGWGTTYEVLADRGDILDFVKSYHPEVWKRWAGRFTGIASLGEKRMDRVEENTESADEVTGLMPPPVVEMIGRS
jgi:DNA-binding Lrp family transcriptional regulator